IINPIISFNVVINGPEAIAGSILSLLMIKGITAPIKAEIISVQRMETPTIITRIPLPYKINTNHKISTIQIRNIKDTELNYHQIITQKQYFSMITSQ